MSCCHNYLVERAVPDSQGRRGQSLFACADVQDLGIFTDGDPVTRGTGVLHEIKQLIAEVFAQQKPRRELTVVQILCVEAIGCQSCRRLRLEPFQVSADDRRDLDAGDIGQHRLVGRLRRIGHADPCARTSLIKRDIKRKPCAEQMFQTVDPGRACADNRNCSSCRHLNFPLEQPTGSARCSEMRILKPGSKALATCHLCVSRR